MTSPIETREQWLQRATALLAPLFNEAGFAVPDTMHVSTGFPSKLALSTKKRRIGECWSPEVSRDGNPHLFISPVLGESIEALETLVHEIIHAAIGCEHGHKGPFKAAMKALGLEGKPTATTAGADLRLKLEALVAAHLGAYPHPTLNVDRLREELNKTKQPSRLQKAICPNGCTSDGGEERKRVKASVYSVRITQVHLDKFGPPICPGCQARMEVEDNANEGA
jgi:hypothetical protein